MDCENPQSSWQVLYEHEFSGKSATKITAVFSFLKDDKNTIPVFSLLLKSFKDDTEKVHCRWVSLNKHEIKWLYYNLGVDGFIELKNRRLESETKYFRGYEFLYLTHFRGRKNKNTISIPQYKFQELSQVLQTCIDFIVLKEQRHPEGIDDDLFSECIAAAIIYHIAGKQVLSHQCDHCNQPHEGVLTTGRDCPVSRKILLSNPSRLSTKKKGFYEVPEAFVSTIDNIIRTPIFFNQTFHKLVSFFGLTPLTLDSQTIENLSYSLVYEMYYEFDLKGIRRLVDCIGQII